MDVDRDTRGATLAEVIRVVEAGVKAVVVTHLYGLAIPEIELIAEYCAGVDIPLLEDCAQAHGAQINGKRVVFLVMLRFLAFILQEPWSTG